MENEITELLNLNIIEKVSDIANLKPGMVVRRIAPSKNQQGQFTGFDNRNGLILVNVIDVSSSEFQADAGIVRPSGDDSLYYYTTSFSSGRKSSDAMEILTTWPLYRKNPEFHAPMESFFRTVFSPDHILYMKQNDMLDTVFVPLQQKLKIGRYTEIVNWDSVRKEMFSNHLKELKPGDHMTYLALVPQSSSYTPKFYSIGTKPHEETMIVLRTEGFNFKPTHGGHIKAEKKSEGVVYYVDAGSNFLGKGIKTRLETAEEVAKALRREHRDYVFIPLEGRGAYGNEQSY